MRVPAPLKKTCRVRRQSGHSASGEKGGGRRQEARGLVAGGEEPLFLHALHGQRERSKELWDSRGPATFLMYFPLSFPLSVCTYFLGAPYHFWDRPGRRAKGSLQRAACRPIGVGVDGGQETDSYSRHDLARVMTK